MQVHYWQIWIMSKQPWVCISLKNDNISAVSNKIFYQLCVIWDNNYHTYYFWVSTYFTNITTKKYIKKHGNNCSAIVMRKSNVLFLVNFFFQPGSTPSLLPKYSIRPQTPNYSRKRIGFTETIKMRLSNGVAFIV